MYIFCVYTILNIFANNNANYAVDKKILIMCIASYEMIKVMVKNIVREKYQRRIFSYTNRRFYIVWKGKVWSHKKKVSKAPKKSYRTKKIEKDNCSGSTLLEFGVRRVRVYCESLSKISVVDLKFLTVR